MIVVKVELHSAITKQVSELGRMYIANDGSGTPERGDYSVAVCRKGSLAPPREFIPNPMGAPAARIGAVKDYPRLSYSPWRLIARAVLAAFPEEAKPPKNVSSTLNASVMRGLAKFAHDHLAAMPPQPGKRVDEVLTEDELAAFEWLTEGTNT